MKICKLLIHNLLVKYFGKQNNTRSKYLMELTALLMKHQPLTQRATSLKEDIYLINPKGKSRSQHTKKLEGDEYGRNIQSTMKWKKTDIITSTKKSKIRALKKKAANKNLHTKSTQKLSLIDLLPEVNLKRNFGQMKYSKDKKIGRGRNTEAVKSYDTTTKSNIHIYIYIDTKNHEDLDSEYKLEKDNAAGDYKSITNRALIEARNIEYKLVEQMKPQDQKDNKLVMKSRLEEGIKLKDSEVNVNNQLSPNKVLENNIKISRSNIPNELGYLFGDEKIQLREESLTPGIPKTPANPEESYQMGMGRETQTKYQIKSAVLSTPIQTPSIKLSESNNLSKYMKRSQLRASKSPKTIIELEDRYIDLQRQILKGSQSSKMLLKNSEEKKPKVKGNMEKRKPKNEREYCKLPILNRPSMLTFDEDIHPNKQSKYSKIKAVSPSYQNLSKWSIPTKHWNNRMQHKIFEAGSRPPLHKTFIQNSTIAKLHINLRKQYIFEERVILEDKEEIPGRLAGC